VDIKQAKEQRGEALAEIKNLRDVVAKESRNFSAEENERWEAANADFDDASQAIEIIERARKVESACAEVITAPTAMEGHQARDLAFRGWMNSQITGEASEEQRSAAGQVGLNIGARELIIPLQRNAPKTQAEARAQSVGTTTAGGHLVPSTLVENVEASMLAFGGVRENATIIRTAGGEDLSFPTSNDTGNAGAILAENAEVGEQDVAFGLLTLGAYKYTSKLVRVSYELLQDSAVDIAGFIGRALGERLGRATAAHFATGTGSSQPSGVVTGSGAAVTAASTTAITAAELIETFHGLDPAYRRGAKWMMNDSIAAAVRKLVDSNGVYIWQAGLRDGMPDVLLGAEVVINNDMATAAASAKTVIFGDLSKYLIREVGEIRLRRLTERYSDYDQDGFVAFWRGDGALLDAGTDPVVHLAQAAS